MEAKFIEIPSFDVGESGQWIIEPGERLVYRSEIWPDLIIVPSGFVTDFASIPRIFLPIHPKDGKHRLAAVVHDYLCRLDWFDRKLADRIFYEAMTLLEVKWWRRVSFYIAVRIGGTFKFKRKKK